MQINIVDLIEKNPIAKLSSSYQSRLLQKLDNEFSDDNKKLFVASFYCYLNYNAKTDFIIDLDNIWKWLGFMQKVKAKILLEKNFKLNLDYKKSLSQPGKRSTTSKGGQNKETFLLTIKTFKLMCLKAGTQKAGEIHEYYIKLEELLQEVMEEESLELKNKIMSIMNNVEKEKELLKEKTLLGQFPKNTQCIYYGRIENKSVTNESLIKFGYSNDLNRRIDQHKNTYTNFILINAFKVTNQIQIENAIKKHPILKTKRRNILIENINYTELLSFDGFSFEKIDAMIKCIIEENEYNVENYKILVEKNISLENSILKYENDIKSQNEEINNLKEKLANYMPDITNDKQNKDGDRFNVLKHGHFLYAFEYEKERYKCSIVRQSIFQQLIDNLKKLHPLGEMKYNIGVSFPFTEKIMIFLLKNSLCFLGNNKYEGSFNDVKNIIDVSIKFENKLIEKSKDVQQLSNFLDGSFNAVGENTSENPEVPVVRKSKRAIDQIDPITNKIVASFESIEAAGRAVGACCKTEGNESKKCGTKIGIALRNKTLSAGFLWRYSGISHDDQYSEQSVIKICCSSGEKKQFQTIADAARDANISPPGLRNRILTNVHVDNYHWIFDKNATHYS